MLFPFYILVVVLVHVGAFGIQFLQGDLPCMLCFLQRAAMVMIAVCWTLAVVKGSKPRYHAMVILAALLGAIVSLRQILLHIAPGDPGYGAPVFGYHLYTWALLIFTVSILLSALHLAVRPESSARPLTRFAKCVLMLLAICIVLDGLDAWVIAGNHWLMPDVPTEYLLLKK